MFFLKPKLFFLKVGRLTFMNIQEKLWETKFCIWKRLVLYVLEIVNLVLMEGRISCSYAFLGICEAIFRGRGLIFCVEPHISIYFIDIKSFFNLDDLKLAPGSPASQIPNITFKHLKYDACSNTKILSFIIFFGYS